MLISNNGRGRISYFKQMMAVMCAIIVFVVSTYSLCYVAMEMHHDCSGEDCPICENLDICLHFTRGFQSAIIPAIVIGIILSLTLDIISNYRVQLPAMTLVSQGIRMER